MLFQLPLHWAAWRAARWQSHCRLTRAWLCYFSQNSNLIEQWGCLVRNLLHKFSVRLSGLLGQLYKTMTHHWITFWCLRKCRPVVQKWPNWSKFDFFISQYFVSPPSLPWAHLSVTSGLVLGPPCTIRFCWFSWLCWWFSCLFLLF